MYKILLVFLISFMGVRGMEMDSGSLVSGSLVSGSLVIDNRKTYYELPSSYVLSKDSLQSLTIKNQDIDFDFAVHLYDVFDAFPNITTLIFDTCKFYNKIGFTNAVNFSYLSGLSLTKLAIINSELTEDDLECALRSLSGYTEKELDFSNNLLGKNKDKLNKLIGYYFNGGKFAIKSPVLTGNPFD